MAKSQAADRIPASDVCGKHEFIERSLERLALAVETGFRDTNAAITDLRMDLVRREESAKSQWHEIHGLKGKVDDLPRQMAETMEKHVENCPLNDITEVGIKVPRDKRAVGYETPQNGTRRTSTMRVNRKVAVALGAGIVAAIVGIGIWIGVMLSTGSVDRATGTVGRVAGQAVQAATASPK